MPKSKVNNLQTLFLCRGLGMDKELVKANLRSVIQSCKGGVPIECLERDYIAMIGTPIPFKSMGYNSVKEMIRDMPDVLHIITNNFGKNVVMAVADESTEHIAKMVSRQKDVKSRKVIRGRSYRLPALGSYGQHPVGNVRRFPVRHKIIHPPPLAPRRPIKSAKSESIATFKAPPPKGPMKQSNYEVPPRFRNQRMGSSDNLHNAAVPINHPTSRVVDTGTNLRDLTRIRPVSPPVSPLVITAPVTPNSNNEPPVKIPSPKPPIPGPKPPKAKRTVVIPPVTSEISAKEFILKYVQIHKLEQPVYKTKAIGQKRKNYISTLSVDGSTYRTFPQEKGTEQEAEELVAEIARNDIEKKAAEATYEDSPINSHEAIINVVDRIKEIVTDKPHGVWSDFCTSEYRLRHKENLPDIWLTLVKSHLSGIVDVEVPDGISQSKERCILRLSKSPSGTTTPTSSSSRISNPLEDLETSEAPFQQGMKNLSLQTTECYGVIVTFIATTECIAIRLTDSNEDFLKLCERMTEFYRNNNIPVKSVNKDFYIAYTEDDFWHRVKVESFNAEKNEAMCYFVDIGETSCISLSNLRELDPIFEDFPFQAIILKLAGLEDYVDLVKLQCLDDALLNKTFIAQITSNNEKGIFALLYDTSSNDDDINMNEFLKESTLQTCLDFSMPEVGGTALSYLTNVTPNGDVYLRIRQTSVGLLEYELEKLVPYFENEMGKSTAISEGKMYVTKYVDSVWYRAIVVAIPESNLSEVEVFFVDFGNSCWVSIDSICELAPISRMLAEVPFQAVQCQLNGVPPSPDLHWSEDAIKKLYDLVPESEEIIVKVNVAAKEEVPPIVSLYARKQNGDIISINDTLVYHKQLFRDGASTSETHQGSDLAKPTSLVLQKDAGALSRNIPDVAMHAEIEVHMAKQNMNPSLWTPTPDAGINIFGDDGKLPLAVLPSAGENFDVYVPWVASPFNFVVQPLKYRQELRNLQNELMKFYSHEDNICEMHLVLLSEEGFCAAQHSDKAWYRVRVKQIKQDDPVMATVHFVDYGDYASVEMCHLQPLYHQFKTLPCQAVKASLTGVKPCMDSWGNEECFMFRSLIEEKSLCSQVVKKHMNNDLDFGNCCLELLLIDTSLPNKDIHIHELLIEKKLALAT